MKAASRQKHRPAAYSRSVCRPNSKTCATTEAWGQKRHFYKPLPIQFRHDGFTYRQIAREGNAAIYEQTWNGCTNPSVCYEVIRIRRREGFQIDGRFVEPAEVYPASELWAWTVSRSPTGTRPGTSFLKFRWKNQQ